MTNPVAVAPVFPPVEGFAALLVGMPELLGEAAEAVAAAGGRVAMRIDWPQVAGELGRAGGTPVLCVECRGASPVALEANLPRIDAVASALDLPLIVALDPSQIDIVAATLLNPRAALLVDPTMADRVAALVVLAHAGGEAMLSDGVREGESARLRRLNDEVARIAEVLARLTDGTPANAAADVFDRRRSYDSGPASAADGPIAAQAVRGAIRARRMRDGFFGANLFEDPGWDMLLDLFAAELEGVQVSVSSLCIAAAVAPTTALRWIAKLTEAGLFAREPDPYDRRRAFVALTEQASAGMRGYVSAVRRAGLAIA